jgi:hypothetical protein
MDALLARYLDGELDDQEARAFLEAVEGDPLLEAELRGHEQVLALGRDLESPRAEDRFTARVMDAIAGELAPEPRYAGARQPKPRWAEVFSWRVSWAGALAAAAAVVLAFIGGFQTGRGVDESLTSGLAGSPEIVVGAAGAPALTSTGPELHTVRLVHVTQDPAVERVTVAGTFNDWDPSATPLRRIDGMWSAILVLPAGTYEYMFVQDGERWKTDPLATITRGDGFGGMNAVLDVGA